MKRRNSRTIQALCSACFVISGSLWDPSMTTAVSLNKERKTFSIVVGFEASEYSERYRVSIQSHGFYDSRNVSKVIILNLSLILSMMKRLVDICVECTHEIFVISFHFRKTAHR